MLNPAELASEECLEKVHNALNAGKCFRLEAGAGAGKTYTLIKALNYLILQNANRFLRNNKKIACITYTNVAKDEIKSRTDNHPVIYAETIHAFCWYLIRDFQKIIRSMVSGLTDRWGERCAEAGELGNREVIYNLGYPKMTATEIFLHHDDVIKIMTELLSDQKFRLLLKSKFPIILIDEYQDTNKLLAESMIEYLVEAENGPLMGFFGDHWQKIYGTASVGLISASSEKMAVIGKNANFRSDRLIVEALNKMRPDLPQQVRDPDSTGEILIFDSNAWVGVRRNENQWKEDLPETDAHENLQKVIDELKKLGWLFQPSSSKILMLTHTVLASEQGYQKLLAAVPDRDDLIKKNNPTIAFLSDIVEPGAEAYIDKKFGAMFQAFSMKAPRIVRHSDKEIWHHNMDELIRIREIGTIGDVLDLLKITKKPRLPSKIEEDNKLYELLLNKLEKERTDEEKGIIERYSSLRSVPYAEFIRLGKYIDDKTVYSTKHGVKGEEFEEVLVVFGRGWNQYNWNQMLEWASTAIPKGKEETFERSRNLFYVACSRPKKKLALLFTQKLSDQALATLKRWFRVENIHL